MQSKYNIIEPARFLKKWCKENKDTTIILKIFLARNKRLKYCKIPN